MKKETMQSNPSGVGWNPNECSLGRWIVVALVSIALGALMDWVLSKLIGWIPALPEQSPYAFALPMVETFLEFGASYLAACLVLRWLGKTSMGEFVLGWKGTMDVRQSLWIVGLAAAGLILTAPLSGDHLVVNDAPVGAKLLCWVITLSLLWLQTTYEEIVFRGFFLRAFCGNQLRLSPKAVFASVGSSLLFMALHLANPEVLSQSGSALVMMSATYFVTGLVLCLLDIYYGSLLPGVLIHLTNNFFCMALVNYENTVMPSAPLFLAVGEVSGGAALLQEILMYVPLLLYILWRELQKRGKPHKRCAAAFAAAHFLMGNYARRMTMASPA